VNLYERGGFVWCGKCERNGARCGRDWKRCRSYLVRAKSYRRRALSATETFGRISKYLRKSITKLMSYCWWYCESGYECGKERNWNIQKKKRITTATCSTSTVKFYFSPSPHVQFFKGSFQT
jgi:hypothetical protein